MLADDFGIGFALIILSCLTFIVYSLIRLKVKLSSFFERLFKEKIEINRGIYD